MTMGTARLVATSGALACLVGLGACGGGGDGSHADVTGLPAFNHSSSPAGPSTSVGSGSASGASPSASAGGPASSSGPGASSAPTQPDATTTTPLTASIPATCEMPAMRLAAGKTPGSYSPKGGSVVTAGEGAPLLVDLAHRGSTQVLWQYSCSAGNVMWPSLLVLSDAKGNIVGSFDMASAGSEHAGVTHWSVKGNEVIVDWNQYEGAGFDQKTHHSVLQWKGGKLTLADAPTTNAARPGVPTGAAAGAGGPRPANATPLTESTNAQYAPEPGFKSPSGKNGCQVFDDGTVRCGTTGGNGGELFLSSDGQIISPTADDAPMWPMPETSTLAWGQVRYRGDTVFASTDQGVTVWNTKTGHGALINTGGIHQF